MATERLSMRNVREILRHKLLLGRSNRQTAASVGVSNSTVSETATRARLLGLEWSSIAELSEDALEERLYLTVRRWIQDVGRESALYWPYEAQRSVVGEASRGA